MSDKILESLFLLQLKGFGVAKINTKYFHSMKEGMGIVELGRYVLNEEKDITEDDVLEAQNKATDIFELANKAKITMLTPFSTEYPNGFFDLGDKKPVLLFAQGNLSLLNSESIAVVGSRNPTLKSLTAEKAIIKRILCNSDMTVISGLAIGCDEVAHATTLANNGHTVAVLPSGLNNIVPTTNKSLAKSILEEDGCLISESMPNINAAKFSFIRRDLLIAALARGTLVIECAIESGTMHTVNEAEKLSRPIACFYPEDITDDYAGNVIIAEKKCSFSITTRNDLDRFIRELSRTDK